MNHVQRFLFLVLVTALFQMALGESPQDATKQSENVPVPAVKPLLIVSTTNVLPPDAGLEVNRTDVSHQLIDALKRNRVWNVIQARPGETPATNTFMLRIVIDRLWTSERSYWNSQTDQNKTSKVFCVDLSLFIEASGNNIAGELRESAQNNFDEWNEHAVKVATLSNGIERLAQTFAVAALAGKYGDQLASIQEPSEPTAWDNFISRIAELTGHSRAWLVITLTGMAIVLIGVTVLMVVFAGKGIAECYARSKEEERARSRTTNAQPVQPTVKPPPTTNAVFDKRLDDAEESALETSGHSDAWYEGIARAKGTEILEQAADTRQREAQRRIRTKDIEAEYQQIAAYAAERYGLEKQEVTDKLRKFDERKWKLLDLAVRHQKEENNNGKTKRKTGLDRSEEHHTSISVQNGKNGRSRRPPTWGGHEEERW